MSKIIVNLNQNSNKRSYIQKKVCEEKLEDHYDLLLIGNGMGKKHYCRINNLSKLIGSQLSLNGHVMCLCKRCFKSYSGLNAQHRLKLHKIKCNKNKPITPILPTSKSIMKFEIGTARKNIHLQFTQIFNRY
jgi:hypothetical protein